MPATAPTRDQESIHSKKQEFVRRELWTAAMDLFFEAGFDQTTIDQIAGRANVSRRTFFRYFSSKEDVMALTMIGYGEALVEALRNQPLESTDFEAAKAVVKRVAQFAIDSPDSSKVLQISRRSPAARSAQLLEMPVIEDELASAFALRNDGREKKFTYFLLANITLSATTLCITSWLDSDHPNIDDLVDEAFSSLALICCPG